MHPITLEPEYTRISKGHWKADCYGIARRGPSPRVLHKEIRIAIRRQLHLARTRAYRWASDGTAFVLYYADGWCYDIIGKAHADRGEPTTCRLNGPERTEYGSALKVMQKHVDGYRAAADLPNTRF